MASRRRLVTEVEESLNLLEQVASCDLSTDLEVSVDADALDLADLEEDEELPFDGTDLEEDEVPYDALDLDTLEVDEVDAHEDFEYARFAEMHAFDDDMGD